LIIHIRSGDVFEKENRVNKDTDSVVFKWFVQPPYSFYEKIISEKSYEKIYIVSENYNINPVVNKLMNSHKNIHFLSNDICTDFKILLNSKNLVASTSDFLWASVLLSKNKNIVHVSRENYLYLSREKFNIKYYDYNWYYNTSINSYEEKINLMLNS